MNRKTQKAILKCLEEHAILAQAAVDAPYDFQSLSTLIFQIELKQELEALWAMCHHWSGFKNQFLTRCEWRMSHFVQAIPFHQMPESLTNQLYWQIALLAFKPTTMQSLLEILCPAVSCQIKISYPDTLVASDSLEARKLALKNPKLALEKTKSLLLLAEPPSFDVFLQYVWVEDMIFDVRELAVLPLSLQMKVHDLLLAHYPQLAQAVYVHNEAFSVLKADLLCINNKGTTPQLAMEQLARGLGLAGTLITGGVYAGGGAYEATKRFFDYFNALPLTTQTALKNLEDSGGVRFGSLLDEQLFQEQCVETLSGWITQILLDNHSNALLQTAPLMSPTQRKSLDDKYRATAPNAGLNTLRSSVSLPPLPHEFRETALKKIAPSDAESLIMLLPNNFSYPLDF